MPLYLYHCQSCGRDHEQIQKFSDPPLKKCPQCGGKLEKKLAATSFQLKGGGWYKDGYATPKPEKKTEGESGKKETAPSPKKEEPKKTESKKA